MLLAEGNIRAGREAPFWWSLRPVGGVGQFPGRRRGTASGPLMLVGDERVVVDAWSFSFARVGAAGRVVRRERYRRIWYRAWPLMPSPPAGSTGGARSGL